MHAKNWKDSFIYHSGPDNDPYGAFEENRKKFSKFITKEVILPKADHITDSEYPIILAEVNSILELK